MQAVLIIGAFAGMLASGMPIFLALGILSLALVYLEGMPLIAYPQIFVDHLTSETLVAIPFFVLAASFMQRGGIAKALVDCATVWVGGLRGGLALVCVAATTVFAAISGSSIATAMAMGTLLVPAMINRSYQRPFALGVVGASGTLGILIPPSLPMIVYAIIAEESVPRLFLAGVLPGLLQALLFGLWIAFFTWKKGYPKEDGISRDQFIKANLRALPALSLPVIILGGIYSGIVTVTESAGLAALTSIIVALGVYKGCRLSEIPEIVAGSLRTTASIIFIVMTAGAFAHWIAGSGVSDVLVGFVESYELSAWQFLLFINVVLLALGMFLEVFAVILIVMPIVLPLLGPLGINPIHFAVVIMVNMEVALLTPPIGMNLYVLSSITKSPIAEVIRGVLPFIVIMLLLLILVTYVPEISLFLPEYVYGK
ncbi:TRAP transporter large permease [Roseovarius sp.]|uniref:TRAP transporter large permease n=1 Tax=Roseovarius sp. TaxID=1486281 RepID=UPI003A96D962